MKKVVALLVSILFVVTLAQAVTLTVIQPEGSVTMTRPAGTRVIFKSLAEGIKWWNVTQGNVEVEDGEFTMPNENVSVEAMYTGNLITVTQADGGKIKPGTVGVEDGGSKAFTITPDAGYIVSDVLVDGVSVGARTSYEFTNVTAPHTITASYIKNIVSYTVYHYVENANDTNYTLADTKTKSGTSGVEIVLADEKLAMEGFTYKEGRLTEGGATVTTTTLAENGSTSIYLYYSRNTYTLTLAAGDNIEMIIGEGAADTTITGPVKWGIELTFSAETKAVDGYEITFDKWQSSNTALLPNQTTQDITFEMPRGNVTLVASATKTPITYTITYNLDGGTATGNPTSYTVESSPITLNEPTKTGYTFMGWTGTGVSISTKNVTIPTGSYGNRTYTATWIATSYSITYNLGGGTVSGTNPTTYNITSNAITLINPTREGYTFTGWTGSNGSTASTTVTIPTGSTGNKTYTAKWTAISYSITYNLDGGTVSGTNPTTYKITSSAITLKNPTKEGYNFTGWTGTGLTGLTTTVTIPKGSIGNRTYTANWKLAVNAPVLTDGLTPVNWNGTSWVATTEANWDYNYKSVATATHSSVEGNGDGKWANAKTADGSLYVWIPRYTYKITSGEHSSGNSWNSLDNPGTNKIEIKFSNDIVDDITDGYISHPAFKLGTTQLNGIWVAKYEASQGSVTTETSVPTSSTSVAKSIPGVASWRNISVSNMFDYAYNTYRNADSHLMKNTEWGAVAYLTNAIGRIPYINNSSSYITGNAGGSQDASFASGTTNAWNTSGGVKASTTHNVYGIYDMSGGAYEYVAAYANTSNYNLIQYASSLANSYNSNGNKYVDVYPVGTSDTSANNYAAWSSIKGDAVYETSSGSSSNTAWDEDSTAGAPHSSNLFFIRGRYNMSTSDAGVFSFDSLDGNSYFHTGFRVVLGIQ